MLLYFVPTKDTTEDGTTAGTESTDTGSSKSMTISDETKTFTGVVQYTFK